MYYRELEPNYLDEIFLVENVEGGRHFEMLDEGRKWIRGRFDRNIGIDQPTHLHGAGQPHAHVLGRKGELLGVINFDGTASHSSKFNLHDKDADALRARGFTIPSNNIVEWAQEGVMPRLLLG
jgi:hypothetical protein